MRTIGHRHILVFLAIALIAALILSIGTLDRVRFAGGDASAVDDGSGRVRGPISITAARWMAARNVVFLFASIVLLALGVAAFFGRAYRRILMWTIIALLLLAGFVAILKALDGGLSGSSPADSADQQTATEEGSPGSRSPWARALAAGLIAIAATLLTTLGIRHGVKIWRQLRRERELEDLMDTLADAADRLRAGDDPHSIVLRCYQEMLRILARDARIAHETLTPREFARQLERFGLSNDHVVRLTELFELVRYGRRDDARLADRALACLDEIRLARPPAA